MLDINFQMLFKGLWCFKRQVTGLFPEGITFQGQGYFLASDRPHQRLYKEEGVYTRRCQEIPFQNQYLYEVGSPQHCRVLFPDGRLFYELSNLSQDIQHICGEDQYRGRFEVLTPEQWQLSWRVAGPRKSYEIQTFYQR